MLRMHKVFVFLGPDTFRYSQDRIAKKKAPVNSSLMALSAADIASWTSFRKTDPVMATCCFSGLSLME